jgi:hypothetical protein
VLEFFETRGDGRLHPVVYRAVLGGFALARLWDRQGLSGPERGRAFESALYRFCENGRLHLSERAGSRTLCGATSASGLKHESDGVIAGPDLILHIETKHLGQEVMKGDLMVFNQKGLDFMLGGAPQLRRRPLYRLFLSGGPLSREARRFALLWGIIVVEPEILPLPLLHWLAGSSFITAPPACMKATADRIWKEVPPFVVSLQERIRRLSTCLGDQLEAISAHRIDVALDEIQDGEGSRLWRALDGLDPFWLERVYAKIATKRLH